MTDEFLGSVLDRLRAIGRKQGTIIMLLADGADMTDEARLRSAGVRKDIAELIAIIDAAIKEPKP